MDINEKIFDLVQEAFEDVENPETLLSNVIRKAIRIANLRNDSENIGWLKLNMVDTHPDNKEQVFKINFSQTQFEEYLKYREAPTLNDNREIHANKQPLLNSIPEIESHIKTFRGQIEKSNLKTSKDLKLYSNLSMIMDGFSLVLKNVENKVYEFLSITEKQILYDQINMDIFEQNRRYVDSKLNSIAPKVLEKFISAYKRLKEGNVESRSHALLSCRRILKSVADNVYPPPEKPIKGSDGIERELTEDRYISRLWQFVNENMKSGTTKKLLKARIEDIGNRIDSIYDLSSKGVHDDVSEYEVNQCVIQTYLLIGDILHLTER